MKHMGRPAILIPTIILSLTVLLTACVSPPAPKYQPAIANTELLIKQNAKLAVGEFNASPGVQNHSLSVRGSILNGGSDGTFSTYLRDSLITELQTASRFDEGSSLRITGTLTQNELSTGVKTGSTKIGADFTMTRNGSVCFEKSLVASHEWESSFMGAIAIPAAINNYPTGVQTLLGMLFADPDFIAALNDKSGAQ
jgi:hypothetical protein